MELNRALFLRRRELGLSQAEVGRRSGVSPSFVQNIESGGSPNPGFFVVAGLARALDLDLLQLADCTPGTWDGKELRRQNKREMTGKATRRRHEERKQAPLGDAARESRLEDQANAPSGPESVQRSSSDQGPSTSGL